MKAKLKKISKINFIPAKRVILRQVERCEEIIRTALEVAEKYTGKKRMWFGDFNNAPLIKEGYKVDDIYVNCNTIWVSIRGDYDNGMMPITNIDIWYLMGLTEFIRDNMDEFIDQWELENN